MFYLIFFGVVAIVIGGYATLKFKFGGETFYNGVNSVIKISATVLCVLALLNILLPDAFVLCYGETELPISSEAQRFAALGKLFTVTFTIGNCTFYPVAAISVYLVFNALCLAIYFAVRGIYKIEDAKKRSAAVKEDCVYPDFE